MTSTAKNVLIGIVVVIVILVLGYFAWQERQTSAVVPPNSMATSTATTTGTSINVTNTATTTTTGGYTVTPIYSTGGTKPTAPNYKTPLTFPANTSADVEATYQSQFATAQATLASSPTDYGSWIQLGILREETGDYAGAAADWKYVTEIYPQDPTAFADLGNLYATYLGQNAQAITDYKEAIKLDPTKEEAFYQNLAQVYINEGDTTDAKAVLEEGINAQVIGYQNLQTMLNSMK